MLASSSILNTEEKNMKKIEKNDVNPGFEIELQTVKVEMWVATCPYDDCQKKVMSESRAAAIYNIYAHMGSGTCSKCGCSHPDLNKLEEEKNEQRTK